jgi:hypothetical protein
MFFNRLGDFTPANVSAALQRRYPDARVNGVRILGQHQGSASHLLIELDYDSAMLSPLPRRMFVKNSLDESRAQLPSGFAQTLAGELARSMYGTETRAYQLMDAELDIEAPKLFASGLGEHAGEFYLFLENLADHGAVCPKVIPALEIDRVANLLRTLARLHAAYWASPRLDTDFAWMETATRGMLSRYLKAEGWGPIDTEFQIPYKAQILRDIGIDRAHMNAAFWRRQETLEAMPQTLLHGDAHPGNIYFLPDGRVGLLDWQLARRGPWTHDVSYAIIAALDPDERRAHERDLLLGYRDQLRELGVRDAPDDAALWHAHRQSPAWGLPMWGSTPAQMYSQEEVETVVRRFGVAWVDFDTSSALGF